MSARDGNLRRGDDAESVGLVMLRTFSFVAPVPRTEDVGLDAICTLFRRDRRRLVPEDMFVVQIKSPSVRCLKLQGDDFAWVRSLTMPLFILSVDRTGFAELFSTNRALCHPNAGDQNTCVMELGDAPQTIEGGTLRTSLGQPVLRWSQSEGQTPAFEATAYAVMKAWCQLEGDHIASRAWGSATAVSWQTNVPPVRGGEMTLDNPADRVRVLRVLAPAVRRLMWFTLTHPQLATPLLAVRAWMRGQGVDPDPAGVQAMVALLHATTARSTAVRPPNGHVVIDATAYPTESGALNVVITYLGTTSSELTRRTVESMAEVVALGFEPATGAPDAPAGAAIPLVPTAEWLRDRPFDLTNPGEWPAIVCRRP